ncbi:hypothetical protein ACFE04_001398 [Oxalis oulophora]
MAGSVENVIKINNEGKEDRIPTEAKKLIQSLASEWGDNVDPKELQVIPLKGAMTNEVFQIKWRVKNEETSRKVLVRIYGEGVDKFFNREDEIRTFECMSKLGKGPLLLGRFTNGRIEEFIHARTLSASDLRDETTSGLIAIKLKEFHDLQMPGAKEVRMWDRLRNWLKTAKADCLEEEKKLFRLDEIDNELTFLEKELSKDGQLVGFCHNDLQYGNIMIDEETNSITIIDYEYASHNPVAYDIANHFCEMAAEYHTDTPHILDYKKYPGLEERKRFVGKYLSASGAEPNESEVEKLVQDVEKYTIASHLLWGLWGIISEHFNAIEFDYKEYAKQRFDQYWLKKSDLLISGKTSSVATTNVNSLTPHDGAKDANKNTTTLDVPTDINKNTTLPIDGKDGNKSTTTHDNAKEGNKSTTSPDNAKDANKITTSSDVANDNNPSTSSKDGVKDNHMSSTTLESAKDSNHSTNTPEVAKDSPEVVKESHPSTSTANDGTKDSNPDTSTNDGAKDGKSATTTTDGTKDGNPSTTSSDVDSSDGNGLGKPARTASGMFKKFRKVLGVMAWNKKTKS